MGKVIFRRTAPSATKPTATKPALPGPAPNMKERAVPREVGTTDPLVADPDLRAQALMALGAVGNLCDKLGVSFVTLIDALWIATDAADVANRVMRIAPAVRAPAVAQLRQILEAIDAHELPTSPESPKPRRAAKKAASKKTATKKATRKA